MKYHWTTVLVVGSLITASQSLPTGSIDETKQNNNQFIKPKVKRAQETLMFGNQQNSRQNENTRTAQVKPPTEKRTLSSSGLEDSKSVFTDGGKLAHPKPAAASHSFYNHDPYSRMEKNYEYGKVLMNELGDELPTWDMGQYSSYYLDEDRRKRSDKSMSAPSGTRTTTSTPLSSSAFPILQTSTQHPLQAQIKRSIPIYPEPRYKRELETRWDSEDVLALLASLWEKERRKGNWRNYGTDEYDNVEEENDMMDEEDPRNGIWLDGSVYGDALRSSNVGIPRTYPSNYYGQYASPYEQQYDNTQYGTLYPSHVYYPPQEKRFLISRQRLQNYDPYNSVNQLQFADQPARGYPNYQHRIGY